MQRHMIMFPEARSLALRLPIIGRLISENSMKSTGYTATSRDQLLKNLTLTLILLQLI
jgi:hypothetical protein